MKKSNLTASIMQKVVSFEKKRSLYFLGSLAFILLVLAAATLYFLWITINEVVETRSLAILTTLVQDKEILKEFWQDALATFWDGLPKMEMTLGISGGVLVVATFLLARKRIGIVRKRFSEISKYRKG